MPRTYDDDASEIAFLKLVYWRTIRAIFRVLNRQEELKGTNPRSDPILERKLREFLKQIESSLKSFGESLPVQEDTFGGVSMATHLGHADLPIYRFRQPARLSSLELPCGAARSLGTPT